jgi:hypothetical protein
LPQDRLAKTGKGLERSIWSLQGYTKIAAERPVQGRYCLEMAGSHDAGRSFEGMEQMKT